MVDLKQLKQEVERGQPIVLPLIFLCEDSTFVAWQYLRAIGQNNKLSIQVVESVDQLPSSIIQHDTLYVCEIEAIKEATYLPEDVVVITHKIAKSARSELEPLIVEIPNLEQWQIIDYVNTTCPGLEPQMVQWLVAAYENNIDRIQTEIDKLLPIPQGERSTIFEQMYVEKAFNTFSDQYHSRMMQAIQNKDREELITLLSDPDRDALEPLTISTFVQTNFKRLIKVWLNNAPTPENTGLKGNQIYAINKLPRKYSREQLLKAFQESSSIERKVKEGLLPINYVIDYLLIKVVGDCR